MIVMEVLSRMIFATVDEGLLSGYSVGSRNNDELLVSILFIYLFIFPGCTLIFCESNHEHLHHLRSLFIF